jgi:hypothetical protein
MLGDNTNMNAQSYVSNELIHFVGRAKPNDVRYALFLRILGDRVDAARPRQGWLQASHREELGSGFTMCSNGQVRISTNEAIKCRMLCFCDIPEGQLRIHMDKYGPFGIAFSKHFLLRHGATPVNYVALNARNRAIGRGPQTVADRFDELRADLQRFQVDLEKYVTRIDGSAPFLAKLSPPNTPEGHRLRGRFSALEAELEEFVFGRLKFFTVGLPDEDPENYYMEREWRLPDGLAFRLADVARVILPRDYCQRFREDVPDYVGGVFAVEPTLDRAT